MTTELLANNKNFSSQQPRKILLVEDHDINRMLLSDYLIYHNFIVQGLKDGHNFFPKIVSFKPDIVLLDLKLPDIDGFSLLEQVRLHPSFAQLPIIVVSAFAFKADMERAKKLGANCYLVKPINLNHLITAIEKEIHNYKPHEMSWIQR